MNDECFLSRRELAERWGVGVWTIINREREGWITPVRFTATNLRYRQSEIEKVEQEALTTPRSSGRYKRLFAGLLRRSKRQKGTP